MKITEDLGQILVVLHALLVIIELPEYNNIVMKNNAWRNI